jgi:hypothetical protein
MAITAKWRQHIEAWQRSVCRKPRIAQHSNSMSVRSQHG